MQAPEWIVENCMDCMFDCCATSHFVDRTFKGSSGMYGKVHQVLKCCLGALAAEKS